MGRNLKPESTEHQRVIRATDSVRQECVTQMFSKNIQLNVCPLYKFAYLHWIPPPPPPDTLRNSGLREADPGTGSRVSA